MSQLTVPPSMFWLLRIPLCQLYSLLRDSSTSSSVDCIFHYFLCLIFVSLTPAVNLCSLVSWRRSCIVLSTLTPSFSFNFEELAWNRWVSKNVAFYFQNGSQSSPLPLKQELNWKKHVRLQILHIIHHSLHFKNINPETMFLWFNDELLLICDFNLRDLEDVNHIICWLSLFLNYLSLSDSLCLYIITLY